MFTSQRLVEHGRALRDAQLGSLPYAYPDSPESRKYEVRTASVMPGQPIPRSILHCNTRRIRLGSPFSLCNLRANAEEVSRHCSVRHSKQGHTPTGQT